MNPYKSNWRSIKPSPTDTRAGPWSNRATRPITSSSSSTTRSWQQDAWVEALRTVFHPPVTQSTWLKRLRPRWRVSRSMASRRTLTPTLRTSITRIRFSKKIMFIAKMEANSFKMIQALIYNKLSTWKICRACRVKICTLSRTRRPSRSCLRTSRLMIQTWTSKWDRMAMQILPQSRKIPPGSLICRITEFSRECRGNQLTTMLACPTCRTRQCWPTRAWTSTTHPRSLISQTKLSLSATLPHLKIQKTLRLHLTRCSLKPMCTGTTAATTGEDQVIQPQGPTLWSPKGLLAPTVLSLTKEVPSADQVWRDPALLSKNQSIWPWSGALAPPTSPLIMGSLELAEAEKRSLSFTAPATPPTAGDAVNFTQLK